MKLFKCQQCGQLLYFENTFCERCGYKLGFSPDDLELLTIIPIERQLFTNILNAKKRYRYCANSQHEVCNWLVDASDQNQFCAACRLNHTIPDLSNPEHIIRWRKLEIAKHRLVYTLLRLGLPAFAKANDSDAGLAFDFLVDQDPKQKVIMGHAHGLITINLAEADEVKRVRTREQLGEPYRTLLGHFRHESGHYYWDRLIQKDEERLHEFRSVFGDERADYNEALKKHYDENSSINWTDSFVSNYASAHPWEDWAETWAHYLHVMDTLETAHSLGMRINPVAVSKVEMLSAEYKNDPFEVTNFQQLVDLWIPLTIGINSLNRSMGQPDFYPFIVSPGIIKKLDFIHRLIAHTKCRNPSLINF
jgi:hypothetical protein